MNPSLPQDESLKVNLRLARKVYERGLKLSGSERDWEAYHLAKDVLVLAGELKK